MAVKIHESLWYADWATGDMDRRRIDDGKARASVALQYGGDPYAYDWDEIAEQMGIEEKSAKHRLRQLACSERKSSSVNSCYSVRWHDISANVLLPADMTFEEVQEKHVGAKPVLFESIDTGNKKWNQENSTRQKKWGSEGGRGNKKEIAGTIGFDD